MSIFRTLLIFLLGLAVSGPAVASTVVYDREYRYDLGTVSIGPSNPDLFIYSLDGGRNSASISGYLPANSKITFTYTLVTLTAPITQTLDTLVSLYADGSYGYWKNKNKYLHGRSWSDTTGGGQAYGYKTVKGDETEATALISTMANFDSAGIGTTSIINQSAENAFFLRELKVLLNADGLGVKIGYVVENVPLPAALPLFAAAAGMMMVFAHRRKQQA